MGNSTIEEEEEMGSSTVEVREEVGRSAVAVREGDGSVAVAVMVAMARKPRRKPRVVEPPSPRKMRARGRFHGKKPSRRAAVARAMGATVVFVRARAKRGGRARVTSRASMPSKKFAALMSARRKRRARERSTRGSVG